MRIDDLCLLLKIEALTVLHNDRVLIPVLEVTLIAGSERLRVRVPHKAVGHSRLPGTREILHRISHQPLLHVLLCWRILFGNALLPLHRIALSRCRLPQLLAVLDNPRAL